MKNNDRGFTLIEVMIAIVILSFIVIAIIQITGGAQEQVDRTLNEDKELLQIETAFARFEWDFSQVYSPLYHSHNLRQQEDDSEESKQTYNTLMEPYQSGQNFKDLSYDGFPIPTFTFSDKNEITFFTTSNRRKLKNVKQSHFAWVRYKFETDREADEDEVDISGIKKIRVKGMWVRKVKSQDAFNNEQIAWDDIKSQVLLRNVDSIKFEFWDTEKRKWVENIRLITNGDKIFRGIRITLKWIGPAEDEQLYVRTFRPLFPSFTPEDLYQLAREEQGTLTNNTATSDEDEDEDENDEGDDE
jgi:prepilin-type N-terminal cleavage/methylation domain-containing protein